MRKESNIQSAVLIASVHPFLAYKWKCWTAPGNVMFL